MNIMVTLPMNISLEEIDTYIKEGVDIVRLNFSHMQYEKFKNIYTYLRKRHPQVKILQDLQGQKIRVAEAFKNSIKIENNRKVCFCSVEYYFKNVFKVPYILIPITWDFDFITLYNQSKKIVIGKTEFLKESCDKNFLICISKGECVIRAEKGINFIGINRSNMNVNDKDKNDLDFIKDYPVDYICISFAESKQNIIDIKTIIKNFSYTPKLIAKIETLNGINNLSEIVPECSGILLGRGDLSKEIDILTFGEQQEKVILFLRNMKKELIIGTYIFQNMIYSEEPTVSELTAIQYFKNNNVDTLMLSDETIIGKHPKQCIKYLNKLIH